MPTAESKATQAKGGSNPSSEQQLTVTLNLDTDALSRACDWCGCEESELIAALVDEQVKEILSEKDKTQGLQHSDRARFAILKRREGRSENNKAHTKPAPLQADIPAAGPNPLAELHEQIEKAGLHKVFEFEQQPTALAIDDNGRIFIYLHRCWRDDPDIEEWEISLDEAVRVYSHGYHFSNDSAPGDGFERFLDLIADRVKSPGANECQSARQEGGLGGAGSLESR